MATDRRNARQHDDDLAILVALMRLRHDDLRKNLGALLNSRRALHATRFLRQRQALTVEPGTTG